MSALAIAASTPRLPIEKLRSALLWLMGFAGAFVFVEPSPYEIAGVLALLLFALTGITLRAALAPLLLLLVLLQLGYAIAMIQTFGQTKPVIWVLVSVFLAATALFYAAVLGSNTEQRLKWLMRGYVAAAVIASLVGIAAYFRLFGGRSDIFLLYDRARGTFNDPNVLGAFLVLPGLLLFQRVLLGRLSTIVSSGVLLTIVLGGLFLSFSRAAWAQFAFAAFVVMALAFITSRSPQERFRIVVLALIGALAAAALLVLLLSIGKVADLFQQRATLDQSYDTGHFGRFGRYLLGAELALESPFGIGPLQFARIFPEDPHNTYLNSFMAGGWLSGFAYLTLTAVTLLGGLRYVLVATPWRTTYHAVYAAYLGVAAESFIIDSDHWRHYFLVLGVLWGLMAATRHHLAEQRERDYRAGERAAIRLL